MGKRSKDRRASSLSNGGEVRSDSGPALRIDSAVEEGPDGALMKADDSPTDLPAAATLLVKEDTPPVEAEPEKPAPAILDDGSYTGAALRGIREAKGLSLSELAESTRISTHGLKAIEEEAYERLPDARIYVRGYVICIAQELGLDPEAVAKAYLPRWDKWYERQESGKKPHHR